MRHAGNRLAGTAARVSAIPHAIFTLHSFPSYVHYILFSDHQPQLDEIALLRLTDP